MEIKPFVTWPRLCGGKARATWPLARLGLWLWGELGKPGGNRASRAGSNKLEKTVGRRWEKEPREEEDGDEDGEGEEDGDEDGG